LPIHIFSYKKLEIKKMDIIFCGLDLINQEPADQQKKLPGRCCSENIVVQVIYPWVGIRNIIYRAFFK